MNTYIITFKAFGVNTNALERYLYDSADIAAFWNYIPLVYCVKTQLPATELAKRLDAFFPTGDFMVAEVNNSNIDGRLPAPAWSWFYLDHHEKTRPPAPMPTLGGLFGLPPPPAPPRKK